MQEINPTKRGCCPSNLHFQPSDFNIGNRIRIFLAYATFQDITIREGIVLSTDKTKRWHGKSLELLVDQKGLIIRDEPREVAVLNADGYWVQGFPDMKKVENYYKTLYSYHCISRAERW